MKDKLEKIKKIKAIKIQKKVKIGIVVGIITVIIIGIVIGTLYQLDKSHQILGGNLEGFFEGEENVKEKQQEEDKQKEKAVEIAVKKFKDLGEKVKREQLEVITDNKSAIALYENLGFEKYGHFPDNIKYENGNYADACWMMKKL